MAQPLTLSLCCRIVAVLLIFIHRVGPYVDIYNYTDMLIWRHSNCITSGVPRSLTSLYSFTSSTFPREVEMVFDWTGLSGSKDYCFELRVAYCAISDLAFTFLTQLKLCNFCTNQFCQYMQHIQISVIWNYTCLYSAPWRMAGKGMCPLKRVK